MLNRANEQVLALTKMTSSALEDLPPGDAQSTSPLDVCASEGEDADDEDEQSALEARHLMEFAEWARKIRNRKGGERAKYWFCIACNSWNTGMVNHEVHVTGKKHRGNMHSWPVNKFWEWTHDHIDGVRPRQ